MAIITGVAAAAVLAGVVLPLTPTESASAANASDWDPGYIIDDSIFFDGTQMSANDVQTFLNSKVSSCASGYTCLKDYGQATGSIGGDRYCNGYTGGAYQTAAQIIDAVARSCSISQRAILVLLEKEQGLVSSRSPSAAAYRAATGMGCPDTAPCDPNLGGFFYQVYYGARQYQIYRLNPTSFNYRAGQWNSILKNPNAGCGRQNVYIYNAATAGLYNYTPYVPNDAALANLYGTGDGCSAYGNRNFWRMFSDWFGNPRSYTVLDGIKSYWNASGGASGPIGNPTSYGIYVDANGQGWVQRFQWGTIYASYQGGTAFVANNIFATVYANNGGAYGSLGFPNGEQICAAGGRCAQSFVNAWISYSSSYGAHVVSGGLRDYWLKAGGVGGSLGAATTDMSFQVNGSVAGWTQGFEGGLLVQSSTGGIQLIPSAAIANYWKASGGGSSWIGYPSAPGECASSGCSQQFTGAIIGNSSYFGSHVIIGGFIDEWKKRGGLTSATVGVPFADLRSSNTPSTGWAQNFAGGILVQSVAGFNLVPYGPGQAVWTRYGENAGAYGWPTSERACGNVGCVQQFTGSMISDSSWGAYGTYGGLWSVWNSQGGAAKIGPAVSDIRFTNVYGGGWAQHFQGGVITQSGGGAYFTPYGPILNMWYNYGAEKTWLGWPAGAQQCAADGSCVQKFQNGVARSDSRGGVSFSKS